MPAYLAAPIRRGVIAAVLLSSLVSLSTGAEAKAPPPSVSEKTSEALGKLRALQEAKDWPGVLAVLDHVPGLKPGSYDEAVLLDAKARTYGVMEQPANALEPWERALQISDEHGYFPDRQTLEIVLYLAQIHAQEGLTTKDPARQREHLPKSEQYFRRYLGKVPKPSPDVLATFATVLFSHATAEANHPEPTLLTEANDTVKRALQASIRPKENLFQLQVAIQQQENDYVGASDLIELLVNRKPDKRDYWAGLLQLYMRLSEEAKVKDDREMSRQYLVRAILTYERAQSLGFLNTSKESLHLASLYLSARQFARGTELLYRGMKSGAIDSEPNNWRLLGRFYQENNQPVQAIAALQEGADLFPTNGEIEMQLAELHFQREEIKATLQHAQAAVAKGHFETTKPFSVYYLIAYTAFDLGLLDEAQAAIAAAEKFPEDVQRDAQFSDLKAAVNEAIVKRDTKPPGHSESSRRTG